ncbi:hypothetical protein M6B22_07755 [Jatrophihabitans cynanchi]|jgi:hypothetical protein|uniref:Sensor domain-containing protein n=1 Tax=Jatrophihabitans cynanchi TaxID=2944128 RepID=A0ABY7K536_9ACTN|nr:hypothetical protein [Jatrophihabitans sp. SB3-54]WAX58652.1 hypothetical protein M6B22_07755 [Jatrophihabitans sp. SB3-54]
MIGTHRVRTVAALALAAGAACALAACSSTTDGSPAGGTSTAPTTGSSTPEPTFTSTAAAPTTAITTAAPTTGGPSTPPSEAALRAMVLQQTDLPSGWTATAYQPDPTDAKNKAQFAQCTSHRNTESDKVSEVHSDDYNSGPSQLSSQATSYSSADAIAEDTAAMQSPKATSCYEQLAKTEIPASLPTGMKVDRLTVKISKPAAGDPSNVIAWGDATVVVSQDGKQTTVYTAAAFIVGPLVEAEVDFTNVGSPIPASVRQQLATIVAARVG